MVTQWLWSECQFQLRSEIIRLYSIHLYLFQPYIFQLLIFICHLATCLSWLFLMQFLEFKKFINPTEEIYSGCKLQCIFDTTDNYVCISFVSVTSCVFVDVNKIMLHFWYHLFKWGHRECLIYYDILGSMTELDNIC